MARHSTEATTGDRPPEDANSAGPGAAPAQPAEPEGEPPGEALEATAQRVVPTEVRLAPHARRILAFAVDLAFVTVLAAVPGGLAAWLFDRLTDARSLATLIVLALVLGAGLSAYSTTTTWLTGGQSPGKAMLALAVRRLPDAPPQPDLRGLAWTAGRCSVGYLVIDVLGVGMLLALLTPDRRCPHDHVFGSRVVLMTAEAERPGPHAVINRLRDWDERRQAAQRDVVERYGWLGRLVKWLARVVAIPVTVILALGSGRWILEQVFKWLNGTSTEAPPAGTGSAHVRSPVARAAIATAGAGATAGVTLVAVLAVSSPSIGGVWDGTLRVERTGADAYTGVGIGDTTDPDTGCVFRSGETEWRIKGDGPHYQGEVRWASGSGGEDCEFRWGKGTFALREDGETMEVCSRNPWDTNSQCDTWTRTS